MRSPIILLACGCFNPTTNMHLRLFEIAKDYVQHMGQYEVVGGIISPVHDGYGKKELESATHRINMIRLSLQGNDWVKLSDWEVKQESWTRTRQTLQYHQNHINAFLHSTDNNLDINEDELQWMPDNIRKRCANRSVTVKLLCGADLLESFGTPGLWADEDIEAIVGQHGLMVITRSNVNPAEFIYNSDVLTKYMPNITIITEWIRNEISSTKIRRALRRSESVKYLLPDKVIDYIYKHSLYGSEKTRDTRYDKMSVNPTDSYRSHVPTVKHPGQAVKIITATTGDHKIFLKDSHLNKEVCVKTQHQHKIIKSSKSCTNFEEIDTTTLKQIKLNTNLKECKSCDENLIKFIFTKHGIQVISDVETIV